ncbi:MAG TPA: hypothetical protein DEF45_24325 [Rhodopirellula sp.]|nr:hypothetical protein [Rhodopirellula sp.]
MSSEQPASAWSAASNRMTITESGSITSAFLNELRCRRRRSSLGLAFVAAAFTALTLLSIVIVLSQGDLHFKHAITFALQNVLIWTGWIYALTKHISQNRAPVTAGLPVREALQRSISQQQLHLTHLRIIAIGLLLSTPLVALSIYSMLQTGRLSPEDFPLRIVLTIGAYGIAFACLRSDYFGQPSLEIANIKSLLRDYDRYGEPDSNTPC